MTEQAKKRDAILEKIIGDSHGAINYSTLEKVFDAGYAESEAHIKQVEAENAHLRVLNNATNSNWPYEKKLHEENAALKSRIEKLRYALIDVSEMKYGNNTIYATMECMNYRARAALKADEEAQK